MNVIANLEEKWKLWLECLNGEDTNSIFRQIYTLTWDAAIFRLIIETRRVQIEKHPDKPELNPHLHNFIDRNFFRSQVSLIRRLIEPSEKSTLYGSKGVYSLSALIKDMEYVRSKLTRERYFILRNIPYDYQEIRKREGEFIIEQARKGVSSFFIPPEYNWESSSEAHVLYDKLSGVTNRSPNDIISIKVYRKLLEKVRSFYTVTRYVDKYIAHSATPDSRLIDNVNEETITWEHLWDAHKSIYEIAEFLALILSGSEHVPLALESPSMYEHWDTPLVSVNDINQLELAWNKYKKETEDWRLKGTNRVWDYINSSENH